MATVGSAQARTWGRHRSFGMMSLLGHCKRPICSHGDCMTKTPPNMEEISRAALKHLEGKGKIIRLHIDKGVLMKLGASFLVGKAQLGGHLGNPFRWRRNLG